MFKMVTMERTKVPVNAVVSDQTFVGRVSLSELVQDQPVLATQIALRNRELGMAYGIPRGQRAQTIALDIVGAVTDFIQAGNRVDVLVSFQKDGKTVVRTVIQDVLILATGVATSPKPPPAPAAPAAGAAPGAKTENAPPKRPEMPYTLAVTPAQAQLVFVADEAGDLRLVLRAMGDHEILPLPAANSWTLVGPIPKTDTGTSGGAAPPSATAATPQPAQQQQMAPPPPPRYPAVAPLLTPVAPASRKPSVEIIRGGTRETITPD
jgi:pilus assembly protein CpaB